MTAATPARFDHGDMAVTNTKTGGLDIVVVQHHDDGWVEITTPDGDVGWTVHERTLSRR